MSFFKAGQEMAEKQLKNAGGVSAKGIFDSLLAASGRMKIVQTQDGVTAQMDLRDLSHFELSEIANSMGFGNSYFDYTKEFDKDFARLINEASSGGINRRRDVIFPYDVLTFNPVLAGIENRQKAMFEPQRVTAAQIHSELYAEAETMLMEPEAFTKAAPVPSEQVSILKQMGFVEQPEVREFNNAENQYLGEKSKAEGDRSLYHEMMALILKFPNYKFISNDGLNKVADKYQLAIKHVGEFIGAIPEANVLEMSQFIKQLGDQQLTADLPIYREGKFYIAAPSNQFKPDFRFMNTEIPRWLLDDPIVLYPALRGFLIVTAWGDEAKDPDVANERHN